MKQVHLVVSFIIVIAAMVIPARAQAAPRSQTGPDPFVACDSLTEDAVRAELNAIAQEIFGDANATAQLDAIVSHQWTVLDMDGVVDTAVEQAVAQAQRDSATVDTILSGWSPAKAEELTAEVAALAFAGETFRSALDTLAAAVAYDIEAELGRLSAASASENLACLQQFIARNYSDAVLSAFQETIRREAGTLAYTPDDAIDSGILTVLEQHKPAIGGIGVIIAAQVSRKLLQRLGRTMSRRLVGRISTRLLGRVGATVIPLAGWLIGGGLIAYDIIDSLDGALPQIEQSLTAPEVKEAIRLEVVRSIEPELQRELPQLARAVADDLYSQWLDFKRQYRQVLDLATHDGTFAVLLGASQDLAALADLLDSALATIGPAGVTAALADGTFAQLAMLAAPAATILRDTGTPDQVLAWAALAGSRLDEVVALELHTAVDPAAVDAAMLADLFALQDRTLARKLALLEPAALTGILTVSSGNLPVLAELFTPGELTAVGGLLAGLDPARKNQLVTALLANPAAVGALTRGAGQAVVASRDIGAALAFVSTPADTISYGSDLLSLARRTVPLRLFVAKYGPLVTVATVALPLLVLIGLIYTILSLILSPFAGLARLFSRRGR